jgi:hypothetical protein
MKRTLTRGLALSAALTLAFTACNKGEEGGKGPATAAVKTEAKAPAPAFLKYVPADTPYVFANLEPAPQPVFDKLMTKVEPMMADLEGLLNAELAKAPTNPEDVSEKVGRAILEEFKGRLNRKGLEELGFSAQIRMAIYGIGFLPAVRMELKNADAFKAAVARVEAKSGQKLAVTKTGDVEHWIIDKGEGFFVAGIQGGELVLGMGPAKAKDLYLPVLFGAKAPAATLESSGALTKLIEQYKFTPHGAGFVDLKTLSSIFVGTATGLNADIAAALREPTEPTPPPECQAEIPALAANFPRVVFGYEEFNDRLAVANLLVESTPALGQELAALALPVPGLTSSPAGNPALVFGLGIDLEKTMALAKTKAGAVQAAPYKCMMLGGLNEAANDVLAGLSQPLPPFINMVKGLSLTVKDAKIGPGMGPDPLAAFQDAQAYLTISSASPAELLGMVKVMLPPPFAALTVAPDGKPVAIPTEGLPPFIKTPTITMTSNALALSAGEGMDKEVGALLAAPPAAGDRPLFVIGYHLGKVMTAVSEKLKEATANLPPEQKAEIDAQLARNKSIAELIGLVGFSLHAGDKGISFKPRVHFN